MSRSGAAPAVEVSRLTRVFRASRGGGEVQALAGVDLRIERGEVFGLLGPNGAGKTTLISAVCNLIRITSGEIDIFGRWVPGEVAREPLFDPEGERVRA